MPHVYITLKERQSSQSITQGAFVSVQQDKWLEGFKEIFKEQPDSAGVVDFEATSTTKYRIVGDGAYYHSNEMLIDTGFNLVQPIRETLYLEKRAIPLPDIPDPTNIFRDVGLGQMMPFVIGLVALAVILLAIAYIGGKAIAPKDIKKKVLQK
jgi:hypothetical protein